MIVNKCLFYAVYSTLQNFFYSTFCIKSIEYYYSKYTMCCNRTNSLCSVFLRSDVFFPLIYAVCCSPTPPPRPLSIQPVLLFGKACQVVVPTVEIFSLNVWPKKYNRRLIPDKFQNSFTTPILLYFRLKFRVSNEPLYKHWQKWYNKIDKDGGGRTNPMQTIKKDRHRKNISTIARELLRGLMINALLTDYNT